MAEQIPYGVAASLIDKLASLAFREIGRIYGVSDKLEDLKKTLESTHIVLSDAEQRQSEDPVIKHWISRFKQVLHDADDLLDGLAIKDLRCKVDGGSKGASKVRSFFSSENPLIFRAKLARKIEKIQKRFNDVAEDMSKLKLNPSLIVPRQNENDWRQTSSLVLPSDIIGREKDKNNIVDMLKQTHGSQNVSLVAIVGIGGLGKTTLAQLVYNDADVQKLFPKKVWVCVSEDFEVKLLLKKMLKSLKNTDVGDLELDQLQKMLQEELNGNKYMLVLDDVWNEDQLKWSDLRTYLMCGDQGSKILVTTRHTKVSQTMGINDPYVLNGLTKEESWTLLKNVTFGDDTSRMSQSRGSIGERIAEKCCGVPLAIKTMGGFLRNTNLEWSDVLNNDIWRLCKERGSIIPVLNLSYQNLSHELRQCFAYCSLYPKDWNFPKDELIELWMAQGYLASSMGTQSMEDVGNQYVKTLLMRSFFQDASMDKYGEITSFKLHDLMHDLAMLAAGSDCYLVPEGKGIIGRPMHIAFQYSKTICSLDMLDASRLRTIIFQYSGARLMTNPSFIQKLKYLRVLDLSYSSITQLPESIDKIKHLRYLDLSSCRNLISLPKSIGNLVCLQTLKLRWCSQLVFSIEVITKLINLRHLDIRDCKSSNEMMSTGLEKLTPLQHLPNFAVGRSVERKSRKLNELKELNNIRGDLEICGLDLVEDVASEAQEANLKAKRHLQCLALTWSLGEINKNSDSLQLLDHLCPHQNLKELKVSGYPGVRFSSWLSTLTNIVGVALFYSNSCQRIPPLERLPCLKKLQIVHMEELQCIRCDEVSEVFFPSLETLTILHCKNLKGWQRLGDDNKPDDTYNHLSLPPFPRLSSLEIDSCPSLTCMPPFPHLVKKLKLLSCGMKPLIETCSVQLEPSSLSPLHALRHLQIGVEVTDVEAMAEDCFRSCQGVPPLERLPCLKTLQIWDMDELQYIHCDEISDVFFPSLETLTILHCKNLRGWQRLGDDNKPDDTCIHLSLPPFPRLSSLEIDSCPNLTCMPPFPHLVKKLKLLSCSMKPLIETCSAQLEPSSLSPLHALKHLEIGDEVTDVEAMAEDCFHSCQGVPPLERLPCLKTLQIWDMDELQWIHCDEISDVFFPSLETLTILHCKNLRGWQRLGDDNKPDDTCIHLSLPPFPRLSSLQIESCPNLTCMPPFPHLVEKLKLLSCSMKPLIETCSVQLEPSSLSPLHALRHLQIGVEVTDVEAMAEDWMQNLTSLDRLSFWGSSIIQHMLGHLQHLPAQLQELSIIQIKNEKLCLWEYEENNSMQCLTHLHCLRSLQKISFSYCRNMKALPEQISDLQSLTHISIVDCRQLESLPEAMCRLTNLESLSIDNCPLLLDRCQDESGPDWPKIAHIPIREMY